MNAHFESPVDGAQMSGPAYTLTFGHYTQREPWTDVRALPWDDLVRILTDHQVGQKAGTCIVPAVFSGTERRQSDAVSIGVAMLDSDGGATLDEIRAAIIARGWRAVVSSTHSHLTTTTRVKRSHWESFCAKSAGTDVERYLVQEKGYLARIAAGAHLHSEDGEHLVLGHGPCPKFRIALPLLRPWRRDAYLNWQQASAGWRGAIAALAHALGLHHDQACTDTSRLFYLPRRSLGGPAPEAAVLDGVPCDIFALPQSPGDGPLRGKSGAGRRGRSDQLDYSDPETGEVNNLVAWARQYGLRFQIVEALRARRPEVFTGRVADGLKHHIRCPNEAEHTQAGVDAATFVADPGTCPDARGFVIHCRHAHCDGRDRLFLLRRMLEEGWLSVADLHAPQFLSVHVPPQPVIQYVAGDMPRVVDEAEAALLKAGAGLYQRGSFIVRPGRVIVTVSRQREVPALRAIEVGEHALAEAMTAAARWERYDGRAQNWVPIDAPPKVAKTYKERVGRWKLPVLAGIISAPTLRPDGSLLDSTGYDPETGLLLDPGTARFPAIQERPDREAALRALQILAKLVETFPFVSDADRSVALSAILTAAIRRSLPTAPLHAFTAPVAGSGKSLLVDLTSLIATGREAGVIAQGKTEEEFEKRLGALLLAGEQVTAIDNCEQPLGGEFLCQMLTQQVVRARILGRSEAPELPSNAFVTATGNNLVLKGDMTRRGLLCRLDPKDERPELRHFDLNPVAEVKADRGRYLVAALTVLRAYHVAGRPKQTDPLGSFHGWSDWVRSALLWLGQADPVLTMEQAREADPRLEELRAVLECWEAALGPKVVTVSELIDRATQAPRGAGPFGPRTSRAEFENPEFREALLAVAGSGGVVSGRSLGKWLAANKDRIVDGRSISRGKMSSGSTTWSLRRHLRAEGNATHAT